MALSAFDDKSKEPLRRELTEVLGSQKFAEGRGVRLEVRSDVDVRSVTQLAEIKMANWWLKYRGRQGLYSSVFLSLHFEYLRIFSRDDLLGAMS